MVCVRTSESNQPAVLPFAGRIVTPWRYGATRSRTTFRKRFYTADTARGILRFGYSLLATTGLTLVIVFNSGNEAWGADTAQVLESLPRPDTVPSDKVLMANGATIGDIHYKIRDIFDISDPKENYYFFRLANRLHINTRIFVVRDDLLFNTGDPYSPELISESERILRSKTYLYDAAIRPVHYDNNRVDIEVKTRDVWTLSGGVNYSHQGGETSYGYEIQEDNFAGLGKAVRIKRDTNEFRTENEFQYHDPFLTAQRFQLTAGYSYNTDGRKKQLQLQRPFYSLETPWAMNLEGSTFSRQEILYESGEEADYFYQDEEFYELSGGYSRGQIGNHTGRWQLGFTVDRNRFNPVNATRNTGSIPDDRSLAYPWIQYDSIISRYIKTSRINLIGRTEDINLGTTYYVQLGWSHDSFGSDRNALIYDFNYYNTNQTFADHLLLFKVAGSGRLGEGYTQNLLLETETRYFYPLFANQMFYTELDIDIGHHLDGENQLLLGGASGLRGYPARIQDGNRRVLFRMEQRYYTDWHVLQLFYVGGAAFFDMGRAWTPDVTPESHAGFLKDVGMGLRLSPSRTSRGTIIHLDLAYALDAEAGTKKFQFLVSTESRF
jgi:outer membrane protein assembly factor BamA